MKRKVIFTVVIIFTAVIVIAGLIFMTITQVERNIEIDNMNEDNWIIEILEPRIEKPIVIESISPSPILSVTPSVTPYITNVPVPTVTVTVTIPSNVDSNADNSFASIEINTSKRTRTYEIMSDVNERTLKKNIGWLPSSSLPNQDGLCILMGHRDTDFSILRYAEIGDEFTICMNDSEFKYSVSSIEIVNSDNELRFKAHNGSTLLLVTCYPFRYSGHAPKKYIVYGIME